MRKHARSGQKSLGWPSSQALLRIRLGILVGSPINASKLNWDPTSASKKKKTYLPIGNAARPSLLITEVLVDLVIKRCSGCRWSWQPQDLISSACYSCVWTASSGYCSWPPRCVIDSTCGWLGGWYNGLTRVGLYNSCSNMLLVVWKELIPIPIRANWQ